MNKPILVDTTILIHHFRGRKAADEYLGELKSVEFEKRIVSIITAAELFFGCNSKQQEIATRELLENFKKIHLTEQIMVKSGQLRRNYSGKKKPRLPDTLIAATALLENAKVHTHNIDDFSWVDGLEVEIPYQL